MSDNIKAPVAACARHRIQSDGKGITTLVGLHGCPLRCKYCINSFCHDPDTPCELMTPKELFQRVKEDDLYFLASGGGVTFGGGEPLLYPDFISSFCRLCNQRWNISVETSLYVPWENISAVAGQVNMFYIDCKDCDPSIYLSYTGKDNKLMLDNLSKLISVVPGEKITMRIPQIPGFNTEDDVKRSRDLFMSMGLTKFDLFKYIKKDNN